MKYEVLKEIIMEKEIVKKIKDQINEIEQLSSHDRHFRLSGCVNYILEQLIELIKISNDKNKIQKYENIWRGLNCRNDRDVKFAKLAYDKARKKNARYIRETEYNSQFIKAVRLVKLELSHFMI